MTPSIRRAALERWLSQASEVLEEHGNLAEDRPSEPRPEGSKTRHRRWEDNCALDAVVALWPEEALRSDEVA